LPDVDGNRLLADLHRAQLPVDGAHDGARTAFVRFADGLDPQQKTLARLRFDLVLDAHLKPMQEVAGAEHRQVAVGLSRAGVFLGRSGPE
jgi:hypothetical protein